MEKNPQNFKSVLSLQKGYECRAKRFRFREPPEMR